MFFKPTRQDYPYFGCRLFCYFCSTYRFVALYKAILWVRVLRRYVDNPVSQKEHLYAVRKLMHWLWKCGLSSREFVKVAHKHGYCVPTIMRDINKVLT